MENSESADPRTGKSRGFCFIIFKTVASLESALGAGDHVVTGNKLSVKKAMPLERKVNYLVKLLLLELLLFH